MFLQAKYIVIAEPNTGFAGAEQDLAKEGLSLSAEPHILDDFISTFSEPKRKIDIGDHCEIRAVLAETLVYPGGIAANRIDLVDNQDIYFEVVRPDPTLANQYVFLTKCVVIKKYDLSFRGGENQLYIPITIETMNNSILDILYEENLLGEDPGLVPDTFNLLTEAGEALTAFVR